MYNWYIIIIVFLITFLINLRIGYFVFGEQFKDDSKINYGVSDFSITAISVIIFYIIATISLLVLIVGRSDLLLLLVPNNSCGIKLLDSGLLFAICLVIVGYFIRGIYRVIYYILYQIGKKSNVKYLDKIHKNEQTLIIIISCITLILVGIRQKDYDIAMFTTSLILGKFFWVDASFKDFFSDIKGLFITKDYKINIFALLVFLWILDFYIMFLFDIHYLISNVIGLVFGFIVGIFLCAWKNRHKF